MFFLSVNLYLILWFTMTLSPLDCSAPSFETLRWLLKSLAEVKITLNYSFLGLEVSTLHPRFPSFAFLWLGTYPYIIVPSLCYDWFWILCFWPRLRFLLFGHRYWRIWYKSTLNKNISFYYQMIGLKIL